MLNAPAPLRAARALAATVAALCLAACNGISFANESQVEGTYTLRSVNGQAPPVAPGDRTVAITVTSGVLKLSSNGDWSEALSGTSIENGQTTQRAVNEEGHWMLRAPYVELVRSDGATAYSGAFSSIYGPKLELQRVGWGRAVLYVYAR